MNALLGAFDNKDLNFLWPSESEECDFEGGDITDCPSCQLKLQDDSDSEALHEDIK